MYLELPKIIDSYGRTAIQLQEEIINVSMSRELAYLLRFVDHPTKGEALITIQNTTKHAVLSSHQRPPNFLYCNLSEYQSIGNQKAPLLRIMPADENNTSQVETIQFDLLEPIGIQTQVESFKDIEYLPASAIQDGVHITFEMGKDERFTDLSELVIKTVVEVQGENGAALTGKQFTDTEAAATLEKVGVINNLGHGLWEQIVLSINDTKVTESSNNYA